MADDIKNSQILILNSMNDLLRLLVSNGSHRGGSFIYYGEKDEKKYFFINHIIPHYYDLRGLPVMIAALTEEAPEYNFIEYKAPNEVDGEMWRFVDNIKDSPKIAYIPIIRISEFPTFLMK